MPRKPKNLTASEAQGLRRVRDRGPTAWAASVHNRSGGAVSRMFERLADKGLCTRAPHTITEKGIEALRVYDAIGDRRRK